MASKRHGHDGDDFKIDTKKKKKGASAYSQKYLEKYSSLPGITPSTKGDGFAYCKYCSTHVSIAHSGYFDITRHFSYKTHIRNLKTSSTPSYLQNSTHLSVLDSDIIELSMDIDGPRLNKSCARSPSCYSQNQMQAAWQLGLSRRSTSSEESSLDMQDICNKKEMYQCETVESNRSVSSTNHLLHRSRESSVSGRDKQDVNSTRLSKRYQVFTEKDIFGFHENRFHGTYYSPMMRSYDSFRFQMPTLSPLNATNLWEETTGKLRSKLVGKADDTLSSLEVSELMDLSYGFRPHMASATQSLCAHSQDGSECYSRYVDNSSNRRRWVCDCENTDDMSFFNKSAKAKESASVINDCLESDLQIDDQELEQCSSESSRLSGLRMFCESSPNCMPENDLKNCSNHNHSQILRKNQRNRSIPLYSNSDSVLSNKCPTNRLHTDPAKVASGDSCLDMSLPESGPVFEDFDYGICPETPYNCIADSSIGGRGTNLQETNSKQFGKDCVPAHPSFGLFSVRNATDLDLSLQDAPVHKRSPAYQFTQSVPALTRLPRSRTQGFSASDQLRKTLRYQKNENIPAAYSKLIAKTSDASSDTLQLQSPRYRDNCHSVEEDYQNVDDLNMLNFHKINKNASSELSTTYNNKLRQDTQIKHCLSELKQFHEMTSHPSPLKMQEYKTSPSRFGRNIDLCNRHTKLATMNDVNIHPNPRSFGCEVSQPERNYFNIKENYTPLISKYRNSSKMCHIQGNQATPVCGSPLHVKHRSCNGTGRRSHNSNENTYKRLSCEQENIHLKCVIDHDNHEVTQIIEPSNLCRKDTIDSLQPAQSRVKGHTGRSYCSENQCDKAYASARTPLQAVDNAGMPPHIHIEAATPLCNPSIQALIDAYQSPNSVAELPTTVTVHGQLKPSQRGNRNMTQVKSMDYLR